MKEFPLDSAVKAIIKICSLGTRQAIINPTYWEIEKVEEIVDRREGIKPIPPLLIVDMNSEDPRVIGRYSIKPCK